MIASAAGFGWRENLDTLEQYLAITDFDEGSAWAQEHGKADYLWSKLAINAYVAFGITCLGSIMVLWKRDMRWDAAARSRADGCD